MPEQVYDPNLDVWYIPSDGDDGSGSGSTPTNVQGLVDLANNSTESSRDSSWWDNFLNNGKYVWSKLKSFFERNNKGFKDYTISKVNNSVMPTLEESSIRANNLRAAGKLVDSSSGSTSSSEEDSKSVYGSDVNQWLGLLQELIDKQYRFNESNAIRAQQFEEEEAQKLRDWQEYMSSTSYQRAMADLRKAGINPLLAIGNLSGASTPSGAMASGFNASGSLGSASSYFSSLTSQLGQNKQVATSFLSLIVKLLGLITMI